MSRVKTGVATLILIVAMIASILPLVHQPKAVAADSIVISPDGWGWQNPLPQGNDLYSTWASSPSDVFAVGDTGVILHYDGSSWSPMNSGTQYGLSDIWGDSSSNIFAVGYELGLVIRYDGSTWNRMDTGSIDTSLSGVWGVSSNDVYAVGYDGIILHYSGGTWSTMNSGITGGIALYDVWGSSSSNVYAVGYDYEANLSLVLRYNGSTWSQVSTGCTRQLWGVWGSSTNDVYAVGDGGTILHYNGTSWTSRNQGNVLYGVWGSSSSDVFIAGDHTMLHYDGSSWISMNTGTGVLGVWFDVCGSSATDVFAVGYDGMILRYNGSTWSQMSSGYLFDVTDVWGSSSSNVYAVGYDWQTSTGPVLHYDGSTWSRITSAPYELYGVWGSSSSDVFAVGDHGVIRHFNGSAWSAMTSPTTYRLRDVWGSSSSDVFAVASQWDIATQQNLGAILHYNGTAWSVQRTGIPGLSGVWGSSSSDVFVVGQNGTIFHYDGNSWTYMISSISASLSGVWGSSPTDVFAVGSSTYYGVYHYDGATWSPMTNFPGETMGKTFQGVWGTSSSDVYACWDGIYHYNGTTWSRISQVAQGLCSIWGSSTYDVFTVGYGGRILHYLEGATPPNSPPAKPTNASPTGSGVSLTPTLQASAFSDPDAGDTMAVSQWEITATSGDYSSPVFGFSSITGLPALTVPSGTLDPGITYYWHVKYQDNHGAWSSYSNETSFTTITAPNQPPAQPSNVSPSNGAPGIGLTPTLQSSTFSDPDAGDTMAVSQWEITMTSGDYSAPVYGFSSITGLPTLAVPSGTLNPGITYYWHVKYQDNHGAWSSYSNETSFTTAAVPPAYGSMSVTSDPPGALFTLDGPTYVEMSTPWHYDYMTPGDYTITWENIPELVAPGSSSLALAPGGSITRHFDYTVPPEVTAYAPKLHYDTSERFFPTDVHGDDQYVGDDYVWNNHENCGADGLLGSKSVCYYHIRPYESLGFTVYEYWYYYAYNDFGLLDHEHDFEAAWVWVDSFGQPFYYVVSYHQRFYGYNVSSIDELQAYVELGSHGMVGSESDKWRIFGSADKEYLSSMEFQPVLGRLSVHPEDLDEEDCYLTYESTMKVEAPWNRPEFWDPTVLRAYVFVGGVMVVIPHSPVEVALYDSEGRVTGVVDGELKYEIPDSSCDPETGKIIVLEPSGIYRSVVVGLSDGAYGLTTSLVQGDQVTTFDAANMFTSTSATHEYTFDSTAFSNGDAGASVTIDTNGDGYTDQVIVSGPSLQPSVSQVTTATGTGVATFAMDGGPVRNLTAIDDGALPTDGKPSLLFPHGLFEFDITGLEPGGLVTLYITLPYAVPTTAQYWKWNPTVGWYRIDFGDNDGDNIITITLQDGATGDDDFTINGAINDQGGPGWPGPYGPGGGGASSAPAFPSIYVGIGAALGAGIMAYFVRRRLAHS